MREEDFPDLEKVYLDSACMSLRPERVIRKIEEYYREYPGCPGRSAHTIAEEATEELEKARERTASLIDAEPKDLVFTSGTTEAINTVAEGFPAEKVFISDREHNSNLVPWQRSERDVGIVDTQGGFDLEQLDRELEEGDLVSIVHVSNLDGYELPVEDIVRITRENGAYTLIDAAQSIPHKPFSVKRLEPDFVAFSGHKMLGPSGTGALYVSERVREDVSPLSTGGGAVKNSGYSDAEVKDFPGRMEAGLPDMAGFIGLGEASEYLQEVGMEKIQRHEQRLTELMRKELKSIDSVETIGRDGDGIVSFRARGVDPHQTALMLDQRDIAVRSGMHCVHSWFNDRGKQPTVRASLHLYNDESDVRKLSAALEKIALLKG